MYSAHVLTEKKFCIAKDVIHSKTYISVHQFIWKAKDHKNINMEKKPPKQFQKSVGPSLKNTGQSKDLLKLKH